MFLCSACYPRENPRSRFGHDRRKVRWRARRWTTIHCSVLDSPREPIHHGPANRQIGMESARPPERPQKPSHPQDRLRHPRVRRWPYATAAAAHNTPRPFWRRRGRATAASTSPPLEHTPQTESEPRRAACAHCGGAPAGAMAQMHAGGVGAGAWSGPRARVMPADEWT